MYKRHLQEYRLVNSDSESQDFKIEINAFPTAGGIEAEEEDLMILEDPERKDSWVIEVKPTQTEVGKHVISTN